MSHPENNFNQIVSKHQRRAKAAAGVAGLGIFAGVVARGAHAQPVSLEGKASAGMIAGKNEKSMTPESLITSVDGTMLRLASKVKFIYSRGNQNIKMTPYKETLLNGTAVQLDYYVVSVPKGSREGSKIYDKFVVASAVGGEEVAPNLYRVAFNTAATPEGINPAFDPFVGATEFMQMGAANATKKQYGLNVTTGKDKAKYKVYGIDAEGSTDVSAVDLRAAKTTTTPVSVNQASIIYSSFEAAATKILAEASSTS